MANAPMFIVRYRKNIDKQNIEQKKQKNKKQNILPVVHLIPPLEALVCAWWTGMAPIYAFFEDDMADKAT